MSVRVVLVAARDEEALIAATVTRLRNDFPEAEIVVADDGSRDGTAAVAEAAGARVERLPGSARDGADARRAWTASRAAPRLRRGRRGRPATARVESAADLSIGVFAERLGGGFGIAKRSRGR